jgi:hypothetical protein
LLVNDAVPKHFVVSNEVISNHSRWLGENLEGEGSDQFQDTVTTWTKS